ncbi:VOC family protein, partial [Vibrio cholerae]|nr:VOC family protein [Vibrio cholerae]
MNFNNTIPELLVRDLEKSISFYTEKLGFFVEFTRQEDNFYFLSHSESQLMLQKAQEDGWLSHGIHCPLGNGIN